MDAFWAVVGGVFISLVAAELYVWLPLFANKLLRYNAKKLPEELSDRLLEEWQSALTDFPGYLTQFLFALDLLRGRQRIIHEFYFPQDPFRPSAEISTRLLAMMCSGLFLLCETPVMLLTALVLRMESSSPILRRDERIGQGARPFTAITFSICENPSKRPKITRVRRLMKKFSVDQFPLALNVLKGNMNFVGPWAFLSSTIDRDELNKSPSFMARYAVRPGLIGLAQLYAPEKATMRQKLRYDRLYIKNRSIWLDLRIIAISFWVICVTRIVLGENRLPHSPVFFSRFAFPFHTITLRPVTRKLR